MTREDLQHQIDALDSLLDRERQALMGGELELIAGLMTEKEELIQRINAFDPVDHANLVGVHEKVTRNQALLNSAMDGIRAVANRMAELRRVRAGLETYDSRGKKQSYGIQATTKIEKRA